MDCNPPLVPHPSPTLVIPGPTLALLSRRNLSFAAMRTRAPFPPGRETEAHPSLSQHTFTTQYGLNKPMPGLNGEAQSRHIIQTNNTSSDTTIPRAVSSRSSTTTNTKCVGTAKRRQEEGEEEEAIQGLQG